jgi:PAS domain S-box-containing protein
VHWQINPYAGLLIVSALIAGAIALFAHRHRSTRGATFLVLLALETGAWSLGYAAEMSCTDLGAMLFWAKVQYLGVATVPLTAFLFILQFTGREAWLTRRNMILLAIVPFMTAVLACTNELHCFIWTVTLVTVHRSLFVLDLAHGPFFWLYAVYGYALLLIGTFFLFESIVVSPRLQRRQSTILLSGILLPWAANFVYLTGWNPVPYLDWTPFCYSVAGAIVAWGLFRYRLLSIIPIARSQVIEGMSDGVLVLDGQARIVDANPVAQRFIGRPFGEFVGQAVEQVFPDTSLVPSPRVRSEAREWADLERDQGLLESKVQITRDVGGAERSFDLHTSPLRDRRGEPIGQVIVIHETTAIAQVEMALRESRRQLEAQNIEARKLSQVATQTANAVIITDLAGNIEYVNPAFEQSTGYTAQEVLGKNPRILKSGEQGDEFYKQLWQTITAGKEWHGDFLNRRKDGTLSWAQASISPIYDSMGHMTHFVAIEEDINARKDAEEELRRYTERLKILHEIDQSILAARLPETIAIAAIHRIRHLIPCERAMVAAIDETGQIEMLAAESSSDIGPAVDIDLYRELSEGPILKAGWVHGVQDLQACAQRSPLQQALVGAGVLSYVVVPLFIQGEIVGVLNLESSHPNAFAADHVTIASEVAASLAVALRQFRLYEQARQEIAERMLAEVRLRQYTTALEAQNAELDAFAHTVAHDLKNPLTTLVAYSDMLEKKHTELSAETVEQFLHILGRHAHKMNVIIDEMLLLSSVRDMEEVRLAPLDMGAIVTETLERLSYLIEEHSGEIVLSDGWPTVLGYAPWVEEIWVNYLSNAIRYGGRPPRVEVGATTEAGGMVRFWVRDNGSGLSSDEQARLFTPFERLHTELAVGHGLGLSIVQRIAKRLGGQVGVESAGLAGQGSTFYFDLPAA